MDMMCHCGGENTGIQSVILRHQERPKVILTEGSEAEMSWDLR